MISKVLKVEIDQMKTIFPPSVMWMGNFIQHTVCITNRSLVVNKAIFRKGLPNETQCYSLVNLTPSGLFRILHIE